MRTSAEGRGLQKIAWWRRLLQRDKAPAAVAAHAQTKLSPVQAERSIVSVPDQEPAPAKVPPVKAERSYMSAYKEETVLTVKHWNEDLFSFTTTRDPSFRFKNGQFAMIGLEVDG
ncbi:MAG: hypothetical protein ACLP7P_11710, partial [Rhodomicrobium sp.]